MKDSPPRPVLQLRSSAGLFGADRMVLALNGALDACQVRSRLLCIHNPQTQSQELYQTAISQGQSAGLLPCRGRIDPATSAELKREIHHHRAVVLHTHDYKSTFYAWITASRCNRRPKLVATLHGWVETDAALRIYTRLELALLKRFDALVAVSAQQRGRLLASGIPESRIHVIDNGIAMPAPARGGLQRESLGVRKHGYLFAAVARLAPEKNLAQLVGSFVRATEHHPDASLLIVGDGPERARLEAMALRPGLAGRVHFVGIRDDMAEVYPLIDCLVLPSLHEGMPLVILEAMAHGLPIIASAVGDIPRLLTHAAHGKTVPAGDCLALIEAMDAAASQGRCRDTRAQAYVNRQHTDLVMAGSYADLYRSLQGQEHARQTA